MKFTVLTNFDDYESSINCDKFGIITLVLKPKYLKSINFKTNFLKKEGSTIFKKKVCTFYKKSDNEFLYKYTNRLPQLNTFKLKYVEHYNHIIPSSFKYKYFGLKYSFFKFYYDYKSNKICKLYKKYYLHKFN